MTRKTMLATKKKPFYANTINTSGIGFHFEHRVQAFFVIQMLRDGFIPKLPPCRIEKILFQARDNRHGYHTDDCVVFGLDEKGVEYKLITQIKRSISINSEDFRKTIADAWLDYHDNKFNHGFDKIALITGNLSKIDNRVLEVLDRINSSPSCEEFWRSYNRASFFHNDCYKKFKKIISHITSANEGLRPLDEEIFNFMKSFCILKSDMHEDLMEMSGINLSLINTDLSRGNYIKPTQDIWNAVVVLVNTYNLHSSEINRNDLPDELLKLFAKEDYIVQPTNLDPKVEGALEVRPSAINPEPEDRGLKTSFERELSLLNIIGAFDDSNPNDVKIIESVFGEDIESLRKKFQKLFTDEKNVEYDNRAWKVRQNRIDVARKFGGKIIDNDLDRIRETFIEVVSEVDPALDLQPDKRYMASFYKKKPKYSKLLREGLTNGLAMLAANAEHYVNCSSSSLKLLPILAVRGLFIDAGDVRLWKSCHELLPVISEISPEEFLNALENAFIAGSNPILNLSEESSSGLLSIDYMSGIRWGLARTAWDGSLFARSCLLLAQLAECEKIKPSGQNYALEAIVETVLPWKPQTVARPEKRYAAVNAVMNKYPKIGWSLLEGLLPHKTNTAIQRPLPLWRNKVVPDDWHDRKIDPKEYWEQENYYSNLFVDKSKNATQLIRAIENMTNLTEPALVNLIRDLDKKAESKLSSSNRTLLWDAVLKELTKNARFKDANWALSKKYFEKLEKIANKLAPSEATKKYARLFDNYDNALIEDWGNHKESSDRLTASRDEAVTEILHSGGVRLVVDFANKVKFPYYVGFSLGRRSNPEIDSQLLPKFISDDVPRKNLLLGYINGRAKQGEVNDWVSNLDIKNWSDKQYLTLALCLPFSPTTWEMVSARSQKIYQEYWGKVSDVREMYHLPYSDYPAKMLLAAKRPLAAITCLYYSLDRQNRSDISRESEKIDAELCKKALSDSTRSNQSSNDFEIDSQMTQHYIVSLIQYVQETATYPDDELWKIEWFYLPLFKHNPSIKLQAIKYSVASNPEEFSQMLQVAFPVKKSKDDKTEIPEQTKSNLFSILRVNNFGIMPGIDQYGKFNANKFKLWVSKVEEICAKSGHLDIALDTIGGYLINAPEDKGKLWMNKAVAEILDRDNASVMRKGYELAIINSRGVHAVDPTGADEYKLRDEWNLRADKIEEAGFINLATTLRSLAKSFEFEAERNINTSKIRDDEYCE